MIKIMTNEEKAMEIALLSQFLSDFPHDRWSEEHGAMQMAEWKDAQYSQDESYNRGIHDVCQQVKEYLEKKATEDNGYTLLANNVRRSFINEIINELFKEQ